MKNHDATRKQVEDVIKTTLKQAPDRKDGGGRKTEESATESANSGNATSESGAVASQT